ncbi:MAG: aminotransferase class I/II-fold pyridoxal phosphate-dependent enzyme [Phycisphaerales bacterium]
MTAGSDDPQWAARLAARLADAEAAGLRRDIDRPDPSGPDRIDLRANDYLGLRRHPRIAAALANGASGAGASRLVRDDDANRALERRLARFKGRETATMLPTGYMANLAALMAVVGPNDLILLDRLSHASLLDGARLVASMTPGVTWRTFPHNDATRAEAIARRRMGRLQDGEGGGVVLVTESVFSMEGDLGAIAALGGVRDRLAAAGRSACLLLDEAHATGVVGPGGAGWDAACGGVADVLVATAGKALGVMGGFVCGGGVLREGLATFARPLMYSTGPMPSQVSAIDAALDVLRDEPERRDRLAAIVREVRVGLSERGWRVASDSPTPIVPLIVGASAAATALSDRLAACGVLAPAIRPPTVPRGGARVRLSLHADLTDDAVARIITACGSPDEAVAARPTCAD